MDGIGIGTLEALIKDGLANKPSFIEKMLAPGESRSRLSYLCFSSGTTGSPKACSMFEYRNQSS